MLLILGGTGTYFLDREAEFGPGHEQVWATPYGSTEPWFVPDRWAGQLMIASRHGWGSLKLTPPFVNSRATIWAAQQHAVTHILSWNGVGAINRLLQIHDVLTLTSILDGTKTRPRSFKDDVVPRTSRPQARAPFDTATSQMLFNHARAASPRSFPIGTYACSEGPHLETAAEIRAWQRFGADVVGMTLVPEALLAHEVGIAFAALAYVTNYATGIEPAPGAPRFFGLEVAQQCLKIVLQAAQELL